MKIFTLIFMFAAALIFCSCRAVYSANRADMDQEGSVVFTRPVKFHPFFGSYSLSDFVEITYEKVSRNKAGQLVVEVGIRNRGPVQFSNWNKKAPDIIALKAQCNFFEGNRTNSPMVYSTNEREIIIPRGKTFAYKAVCPAVQAKDYQLILGDHR